MRIPARKSLIVCVAGFAAAASFPAAASAARYDSRTLKSGMHGSDVKQLQRYLKGAGHSIHADGSFGAQTTRALTATERELELRADGIATRRDQTVIRRAVNSPGTGGANYVAPPPPTKVVAGAKGKVNSQGFAVAPASAPRAVKSAIAAGNTIAKTPYKWGGGHASFTDTGYDCSGSVSYALHAAGLLASPLVSGSFSTWGARGPGSWFTIYSNGGHVYMTVAGLLFDTSARSRTGSRWTEQLRSNDGFAVTHPSGL